MTDIARCARCGMRRVVFDKNLTGVPLCKSCVEVGLGRTLGRPVYFNNRRVDSGSGKSYDALMEECGYSIN